MIPATSSSPVERLETGEDVSRLRRGGEIDRPMSDAQTAERSSDRRPVTRGGRVVADEDCREEWNGSPSLDDSGMSGGQSHRERVLQGACRASRPLSSDWSPLSFNRCSLHCRPACHAATGSVGRALRPAKGNRGVMAPSWSSGRCQPAARNFWRVDCQVLSHLAFWLPTGVQRRSFPER